MMTKEEAIDLLDNLIGMITDNQDSDYDEALKMAIKALKERPNNCEDEQMETQTETQNSNSSFEKQTDCAWK